MSPYRFLCPLIAGLAVTTPLYAEGTVVDVGPGETYSTIAGGVAALASGGGTVVVH
jgi:hypothetical protein